MSVESSPKMCVVTGEIPHVLQLTEIQHQISEMQQHISDIEAKNAQLVALISSQKVIFEAQILALRQLDRIRSEEICFVLNRMNDLTDLQAQVSAQGKSQVQAQVSAQGKSQVQAQVSAQGKSQVRRKKTSVSPPSADDFEEMFRITSTRFPNGGILVQTFDSKFRVDHQMSMRDVLRLKRGQLINRLKEFSFIKMTEVHAPHGPNKMTYMELVENNDLEVDESLYPSSDDDDEL